MSSVKNCWESSVFVGRDNQGVPRWQYARRRRQSLDLGEYRRALTKIPPVVIQLHGDDVEINSTRLLPKSLVGYGPR